MGGASMAGMAAGAGAPPAVTASGLSIELDQKTGRLERIVVRDQVLPLTGHIQLLESFREARSRGAAQFSAEKAGTAFRVTYEFGSGEHELSAAGTHILYRLRIRPGIARRCLLECRLVLELRDKAPWRWWDGFHEPASAQDVKAAAATTTIPTRGVPDQGLFPACAVLNDTVGIGIGLPSDLLCSYYGSGIAPGKAETKVHYAIRRAVNPGETADFAFVVFGFDAQWGVRSVLNSYYSIDPARHDRPQLRPDALGMYALVAVEDIHKLGDRFIDYCRRARVGGMELYAPFSRTGEFFTASEPAYVRRGPDGQAGPGKKPATASLLNPDLAAEPVSLSQKELEEVYTIANIASLTLSYVIPTKCERKLAMERFDDSIIRLADGKRYIQDGWQVMPGEKLAGMDAGRTSFGESLRTALQHRVDRYHTEGVYLDNGAVNWRDYGNDRMFPAFDDAAKVYVNVGLAYALICDFLHERCPGVHVNPGESNQYFSAFRGDSYLSNGIWKFPEFGQAHRFLIGKKPMYFGAPRFFDRRVLMAEIAASPGREAMFGRFTKYDETWAILQALRWGALPWFSPRYLARPDARLLGAVLADLAQARWDPIPHARANSPEVWLERFQRGTQSLLFSIVNPTSRDRSIVITIDSGIHPRGRLPICAYYTGGPPLAHELLPGGGTVRIPLELKANSAAVLRAIGWMEAPKAETRFSVRRTTGQGVTIRATRGDWPQGAWEVNPIRGTADSWDPILPGRKVVRAGDEIEIAWTSRYQAVEAGCLLNDVNFLRNADPFSIVISEDSPDLRANARRIAGFAGLQAELLGKPARSEIVLLSGTAKHANRVFVVPQAIAARMWGARFPKAPIANPGIHATLIAVDPKTLVLTGRTEWDMRLALNKYLDTIEAPIPFEGTTLERVLIG